MKGASYDSVMLTFIDKRRHTETVDGIFYSRTSPPPYPVDPQDAPDEDDLDLDT